MTKILALALALSSPAAFAVTTTCEFPVISSSVTVNVDRAEGRNDIVTSSLVVNGSEVASLSPACFFQNVPGQRGFRCSHKADETRYDIYPKFTLPGDAENTGKVKKLFMLVWTGSSTASFETTDCN